MERSPDRSDRLRRAFLAIWPRRCISSGFKSPRAYFADAKLGACIDEGHLACAKMWPARKRPPDERGIPIALQGNSTPNGYYNAASRPAGDQMRITVAQVFEHPSLGPAAPQNYGEAPIPRERLDAMELVVNLFDGGPRSRVWFSIDDGPAEEMGRSARVDALVAKLHLRIKDRSVFWTPLRESTHIWAAPLPRDLAPGVRPITIRAIDEYGQEHECAKLIEIVP